MLRDFNIEWLAKRVYYPAQTFQSQVTAAFISAGNPVFQEIGTLGLSGVQINEAGDAVNCWGMIPYDLDIKKKVRVRVWLTSSGGADAETITVLYTKLGAGDTLIEPATALSTAIAAYTFTGGGVLEKTDWGVINKSTFGADDFFWGFNIASTMTNASADEISLLGLEVEYTPRKTAGPRRNILGGRRLAAGYPLGVQLHASQEGL